jgi:hypothetical protein
MSLDNGTDLPLTVRMSGLSLCPLVAALRDDIPRKLVDLHF